MTISRIALAALAACGLVAATAACSTPNTDSSTVVQVEGKKLDGAEFQNAGCNRAGNNVTVGSGSVQHFKGVFANITDGNPPTVNTLGIMVGGNPVTVTNALGVKLGSAKVTKSGDRYSISGTAQGVTGSKSFSIEITCK
ncbi:lipoprotein LpqH [Tsukamurella sp. 8F]|uniref:lipoprotein LpqH n=1 Tax=unclassified Tsukamurella TaxID=2633480 RepID=UPI0023B948D8|nr:MULTISPECIES: lipoprotein LpqH [unclassified Tsukamurella]MDF0529996.1 lipoprotein LpqH [Tsukamurella sp. 8J]MDF0587232.1 lipoprotein LpqH [Tsukamurella sp. 8F]